MSQSYNYWIGESEFRHELPDADMDVLPGVRWGEPWALFTPAYWVSQLWMCGLDRAERAPCRAHGSLPEELVFCMLGGYGITAELATAAFEACRDADLIARKDRSEATWARCLGASLKVKGRSIKYRFPQQKAKYLAGAMEYLCEHAMEKYQGRDLRNALLCIRGVGPKTAGWVARNYLDTDDVAILDIHLVRAGLLCGLFDPSQRVERDYFTMESRFIDFCRALGARPAVLDCLIWDQMRACGDVAIGAVRRKLGVAA
jgi:thermostable 8-oxoguanine DNA glycosylase